MEGEEVGVEEEEGVVGGHGEARPLLIEKDVAVDEQVAGYSGLLQVEVQVTLELGDVILVGQTFLY